MSYIYDKIGKTYTTGRRTDPKIAAMLHKRLQGAESILNIGAGSGSYEPVHKDIVALEPSMTMLKQRDKSAAPAVQAAAENIPFEDNRFSHSMSVLSMHHWSDRAKAFAEIKRVTREKFVALTWCSISNSDLKREPYWLYRDYLTQIPELNRHIFPALSELAQHFPNVEEYILPIPYDCLDGFDGAYWQRPQAFLDPAIRENMSVFSKIHNVEPILEKLRNDIESGQWENRNQELLNLDEYDCGYRIFVASL